jgi:glycosyltransferase involved in cell wall biosynthesis
MRVGVRGSQMSADVGGGHTFEREVFDELARFAGESPHRFVALGGLRPSPEVTENPANLEYRELPGMGKRLVRRLSGSSLEAELSDEGIDLVWNLGPSHPPTDVPFLTVVWDLQHRLQPFFPEVSAGGEWESRESQYRVNLRRAAGVIVGTEAGRNEVMSFYGVPASRIHVVPHPTPRFALAAPAEAPGILDRFALPERFVLYPAQFWPHKNHVNLLLALRILRDQGVDLALVLVGSDRGNAPFVRHVAAELGLEPRVHFLGFVTTGELVGLYRRAACLAYVSLFGPENLPPLEAFALGCPVVAANVSGSEEQFGDDALRVDATDPDRLAEAIRNSIEDTGLRQGLIARGRLRASQRTGREFVRGVFGILDGLASSIRCWRPETDR